MPTHDITRWSFALADIPEAWAKGYDDGDWREVTVPHDWSVEEDFDVRHSSGTGYLPGGIGWYRAHVPLAPLALSADAHVRLVLHGVYKDADVWVNGYHLGRRPSGYARQSFDLSEILSYAQDDDLVVAVRVERTELADSRWYNGTGLNRRVEIQVHGAVHLGDVSTDVTTLEASHEHARVRVRQLVVNDAAADAVVRVRHELRSTDDDAVVAGAHTEVPIAAGAQAPVDVTLDVPAPRLWSDLDPALHRLTTTLTWGEQETATSDVVGIRTFAFDPATGFSINGEPRLLKGVCLHDDAGCVGTAVPTSVWLRRLLALQEMGCNAVRMAHNPHAPELYALCDALGFFVIDEAFDEWENTKNKWWQGHNVYPPRHHGDAEHFPHWHERDLVAMIDAHRLHPSIVAWSIGNEIDYPNDPYASPLFDEMTGNNDASKPVAERVYDPSRPDMRRLTTISRGLAAIARRADPSRPVTLAAAFPELSSLTGLLETVDLIGYNYKEHLYAADRERFPDHPFVGSENSHDRAAWQAVLDHEHVAGQFLWTGIDYLGEARGWPVRGSGAGVLTTAGFGKHAWHLRRSWWSDAPVAHLATRPVDDDGGWRDLRSPAVSRAWEGQEQVEVLVVGSGGEPSLRCGGEEIALQRDERLGCWTAVLAPRPEPLVLEMRRDGAVVARDELHARGDAAQLQARLWQPPAAAAGRVADVGLATDDVVQIECAVLDADGRPARADVVVTAAVEDGELVGLENGDLADVTAYREAHRSTHTGRLLVLVRARERARVTLTAPGLAAVTVECRP